MFVDVSNGLTLTGGGGKHERRSCTLHRVRFGLVNAHSDARLRFLQQEYTSATRDSVAVLARVMVWRSGAYRDGRGRCELQVRKRPEGWLYELGWRYRFTQRLAALRGPRAQISWSGGEGGSEREVPTACMGVGAIGKPGDVYRTRKW